MPTEQQQEAPRAKKTKTRNAYVDEATAKALRKVTDLVALAHNTETEDEARSAALTAVKLMAEHRLCVIPETEVERLRRLITNMQEAKKVSGDEKMKQLGIGFVAGMMLSKGKFF